MLLKQWTNQIGFSYIENNTNWWRINSEFTVHDLKYYGKCMMGGILSCGLTHTAVCPLDIIKCRKQVDYTIYKSLGDGFKVIHKTEGFKGLTVGWVPTLT